MFAKVKNSNRSVWIWTGIVSVVIAAWFVLTVEPQMFLQTLKRIDPAILIISLGCLTINGLLDATWLRLITRPRHTVAGPLRVIAWHMLSSSILPARIGEFAFLYFIHRWLEVPVGRALFIVLYHRLQDFIVINLFLLITILGVGFETNSTQLIPLAGVMLVILVIVIFYLENSLSLCAMCLRRIHRSCQARFLQVLLRQVLQVRMWYRHGLSRFQLWSSFLVIIVRWAMILAAVGVIVHGSVEALDWTRSLFVSNVYVYMGIIPIQAVGGFGAGEAGLIWILVLYGMSVGNASAFSLVIRLLINAVHIGIWLVTISILMVVAPEPKLRVQQRSQMRR